MSLGNKAKLAAAGVGLDDTEIIPRPVHIGELACSEYFIAEMIDGGDVVLVQ
jgi:hypothetical protein